MHNLAKDAFDGNQKYIVAQFPEDIQKIYYKPESEKTTYEKQLSYLVYRQADRAATRYDYEKALKGKPDKLARYKELKTELKNVRQAQADAVARGVRGHGRRTGTGANVPANSNHERSKSSRRFWPCSAQNRRRSPRRQPPLDDAPRWQTGSPATTTRFRHE